MDCIWEKAISILAGNFNSGLSYLNLIVSLDENSSNRNFVIIVEQSRTTNYWLCTGHYDTVIRKIDVELGTAIKLLI